MKSLLATLCLAAALPAAAGPVSIQFRGASPKLVLVTADARQQLLATAGTDRDATREVVWSSSPPGIVDVTASGRVTPRADGDAVIAAKAKDGSVATLPVHVERAAEVSPVHFANQIVPIFTKNGCNGGGCHGKAAGQNGFRLSLLGFEPGEDYEHLVKEARGRRVFPASPERSLLLTKAAAQLPHGGGKRIDPGSDDYRQLVRWIRQGLPSGRADAPTVDRIEVFPTTRMLSLEAEQQLVVTAHYTDGSTEDVTRGSLYEPNDKDLARCDEQGLVKAFNQTGEVAIMVRYQGKVATFRGTIPLGAPVGTLPIARNAVDEQVFRQLKVVGMPPSAVCDDATFLRRATVDIAGRLPTPAELAAFLPAARAGDSAGATSPGGGPVQSEARLRARDAVVDRLLASPDYADYFANTWSAVLRNKRADAKHQRGNFAFHGWIRDQLLRNTPYDQFVREIVSASGDMSDNPPVAWYRQVSTLQGQLEDSAQLFLGQRLQCAQCHHHPYEKWSQADYWSFGAFFSQVGRRAGSQPGEEVVFHRRGIAQTTNKKTGKPVRPAGLGAPIGELDVDDDPRLALADWMTSPKNPWFAKALANRYWKHFLGRGLVEPEDDMRDTNPPSNPELLEALASDFVAHGHDLRHLVRTIATSTTYQLSAEPNAHNARDRHHFARFYPRRLGAEVLHDAVNTVVGGESRFEGMPVGTRAVALPDNSFNAANYFLTVFGRPEASSACECERSLDASLSQALHLLNSKDIQTKIAADQGRAAALVADPKASDDARLRTLYRIAFSRDPRDAEIAFATGYIAKKTAAAKDDATRAKARREGFEDAVWALLNTKEFLFNH
ncbi:MAG: DUF1553 domain-containing protein [Verrucomicrobia bacterium]|nr:MAG: DUF1553 domain-containing protein [Verrucomicrobiota bacterium]